MKALVGKSREKKSECCLGVQLKAPSSFEGLLMFFSPQFANRVSEASRV